MTEIEELAKNLESGNEADRIYAAEDIGYANRPEGVAPLLARLPSESSRAVREAIFSALQGIDDSSVTEGAIALLSSEDTFVRNQAVELLQKRGAAVVPFLNLAFATAARDERKMIVDVLASVDGEESSEIYATALSDSDVNVVITAVESLGNAGKIAFRERVAEFAAGENPMLTGACLEALVRMGDAASVDLVRAGLAARGPLADFLLPLYLKLLAAHGADSALAEAVAMLDFYGPHMHGSILQTVQSLHHRFPLVPLSAAVAVRLANTAPCIPAAPREESGA